ncbi:hypothetical protein TWF751_007188 [Orbilia oligospora]|nr:hypothetical protein TWF751_007188 [Orbilia oligospora]
MTPARLKRIYGISSGGDKIKIHNFFSLSPSCEIASQTLKSRIFAAAKRSMGLQIFCSDPDGRQMDKIRSFSYISRERKGIMWQSVKNGAAAVIARAFADSPAVAIINNLVKQLTVDQYIFPKLEQSQFTLG